MVDFDCFASTFWSPLLVWPESKQLWPINAKYKKIYKIQVKWKVLFFSFLFSPQWCIFLLPLVKVVGLLPLIYAASIRVKPEGKPRGQQSVFIYRSLSARQEDRAETSSLDVDGVTGRCATQSSTHHMQSALTLYGRFSWCFRCRSLLATYPSDSRVKQICTAALPMVPKSQIPWSAAATLWLKRGTTRLQVSEQSFSLELDL